MRDLRFALRSLRRSPGFSLLAVATLGLALGAGGAVSTVAHGLLVRPLPFPEPEQLVQLSMEDTKRGDRMSVAHRDHLDWREVREVFAQVAAYTGAVLDLSGEGEPERLQGLAVSADYFPLFAPRPLVGRLLEPGDFAGEYAGSVVLSEGLWRRRFGARPEVVGETVRLNDRARTVVGVVADRSCGPAEAELWVPMVFRSPPPPWLARRDNYYLEAVARLAPGTSHEAARSWLAVWAEGVAREEPAKRDGVRAVMVPLHEHLVGPRARAALANLGAAIALVLLLATANVAGLQMGRELERRGDLAVRRALGAGRGELLRRPLLEGLLLAAAAAGLGLLLATAGPRALVALAPAGLPDLGPMPLGLGTGATLVALAAAIGILLGLLPALPGLRTKRSERLAAGRGAVGGGSALRSLLVVTQIAASLALVAGTVLLLRSVGTLLAQETGLALERRVTFQVPLSSARYPDSARVAAFFDELRQELAAIPGVARVAASSRLPLAGAGTDLDRAHLAEGWPEPPAGPEVGAKWNVVTPGYFATLGVALAAGRDFEAGDGALAPLVAIVDKGLAAALFPDEDPLGKRFRSWRDENQWRTVVGLVEDVPYRRLGAPPTPTVYVPYRQAEWPELETVAVAATGDPLALVPALRAAVRRLDPDLPVLEVATLGDLLDRSVAGDRHVAALTGTFALAASGLAAMGIYALVAFSVARRRREIGLRMALGARREDVRRLVLGQALRLWAAGAALGVAGALAFGRSLASLLHEVGPADPAALLVAAALLAAVTAGACLAPARRAARVDPMVALRAE